MGYCAEIVTFTIDDADIATFLERRRAAIAEVKSAHPQLWAVPMCARRADGTWVDVWIYETRQAAEAANSDAGNLPRFLAMADLLDNIEIEATDMPVDAITPL
ncbi:hypothetical protein [Nocardia sp. R6R-6]|uniref:hypothetical protein n=1 Tax=Nocardia sp. R6R-6 TaxID=3459303 RepID=UPI00403D781C